MVASLSHLLPVPTYQVPLMTVMKRSLGWKCGLLKWLPAVHLIVGDGPATTTPFVSADQLK